jgi:hypothetical protein
LDGTSRMNREVHVRFCERQGVRLPLPTRQIRRAFVRTSVCSANPFPANELDIHSTAAKI